MLWFLIFVPVIVWWVVSLVKIFQVWCFIFKCDFIKNAGEGFPKRNILLVIAHPDDESIDIIQSSTSNSDQQGFNLSQYLDSRSHQWQQPIRAQLTVIARKFQKVRVSLLMNMIKLIKHWFFTPTINHLISREHNVYILCMSTGNADGIGDLRKNELYRASVILKIPLQQVKVLDHPELQDGFGESWNSVLLARMVNEEIQANDIDLIITFDNYGVSGHCNHCDLNRGVRKLLDNTSGRSIEAWELVSTNILRKYSGPVDIWLSILYASAKRYGQIHCLLNEHPGKSYVAMSQHLSQWVWFRKLFVLFSSYTYVNTLKKIK